MRGLAATGGMICWMSAIAAIPLAEATAITFAGAAAGHHRLRLILGETVRLRRWSAIVVGFVGVLIILQARRVDRPAGAVWALGAALLFAVNALVIKSMTRTETPSGSSPGRRSCCR